MQARRPAALVLALGCVAVGTAAAHATWRSPAQLSVTAITGQYPELRIALALDPDAGAPGRITLYVPRGFPIYGDRPPGSAVGSVALTAEDDSYASPTESFLSGDIVAQTPPATAVPCTPGPYLGLWELELSLLGQPYEVPLYLVRTGPDDPPGPVTKLVLCAPSLPAADPSSARAFPISALDLTLSGVEPPLARGTYVWRAVVTPLAIDRKTLRPGRAFELRAVMPVPHRLTIGGRVDRAAGVALLQGRLTANGVGRRGVRVTVLVLRRRVTPTGVAGEDRVAVHATTGANGAYRARVHVSGTTTFLAVAEATSGRCQGRPLAPQGCVSTTFPSTESEPVTLTP